MVHLITQILSMKPKSNNLMILRLLKIWVKRIQRIAKRKMVTRLRIIASPNQQSRTLRWPKLAKKVPLRANHVSEFLKSIPHI